MRDRIGNYDKKYDVLYISKKDNKPGISEEPIDGVVIRRDVDTNKIVGITIFDIKEYIEI